ncbi:MAG TPA: hypothetical protein VHE60_01565 [Pyrinomonadaceae bacterium]|nr:hypothetical protein [Pyrinomonadaceae bacterium]
MQQEQRGENETDNDRNDQERGAVSPFTGTAIAFWVFVILGAVLWVVIHDNIADLARSFEVFIASIFSLALVIVIVIQAAIYFRQAKALDAQLDIARRNLVYAHRAYVTVVDGNPFEGFERGFRLEIGNTGNSPAKNVSVKYLVQPGHLPPPVLIDAGNEPIGLLSTGESTYQVKAYPRDPIKPEDEEKLLLKSESFRLWCIGTILYYDIFQTLEDIPHETKFCFYWEPGNPRLRSWHSGNEAD